MYIACEIPEGFRLKELSWDPRLRSKQFNVYLETDKTFRGSRGNTAQEAVDSAAAILRAALVHYDVEPEAPKLGITINLAHLVKK